MCSIHGRSSLAARESLDLTRRLPLVCTIVRVASATLHTTMERRLVAGHRVMPRSCWETFMVPG